MADWGSLVIAIVAATHQNGIASCLPQTSPMVQDTK